MMNKLFNIGKSTNNNNNNTVNKVIFLDIDGVMNHEKSEEDMDGACLCQLKRIVDATGAKIVLTSSWRMCFLEGDDNPFKQYFGGRLKIFGMEVYDITINLGLGKRAAEIKSWLKEHKEFKKSYVIIDDSMFPGFEKMTDHLCMTEWNNGGLTAERANKAIEILNRR